MKTGVVLVLSLHVCVCVCVCCVSVEEIEQMTGLFQQKQRELLVAVSRVDELSDQLEALRSNRLEHPLPPPHHHGNSSTAELERLYQELQVRRSSSMVSFKLTRCLLCEVKLEPDSHTLFMI